MDIPCRGTWTAGGFLGLCMVASAVGCGRSQLPSDASEAGARQPSRGGPSAVRPPGDEPAMMSKVRVKEDSSLVRARRRMVESDLRGRDITDQNVLDVMNRVARHRFVPESLQDVAYADYPLPIGHRQTISQPYIVGLMTQLAKPKAGGRALDIGTGSGYQAAVLAEISSEVYSIEIVEPLADEARRRLAELGYRNVIVRHGDGYRGWPEKAPFDVIIVAAAPDHVPEPLVEQLAPLGRMVIPVGSDLQELLVIEKDADGNVHYRANIPVRFVPMTGEAETRENK